MDRPVLDLTWDYPIEGAARRAGRRGGARRDQRLGRRGRAAVAATRSSSDDGSTACGCWIYCGVLRRRGQPGGPAQAGRPSRAGSPPSGAGRGRPTGASSTTAPRPTRTAGRGASARRYVWWDAEQEQVGRPRRARLLADQGAATTVPPEDATGVAALSGTDPFIMQADGKALAVRAGRARRRPAAHALRAAGVAGRQPALRASSATRSGSSTRSPPRQPVPAQRERAGRRRLPVRGHHLPAHRAPHGRRDEPLAAVPGRAAARIRSARSRPSWPPSAGWSTWAGRRSSPPRSAIEARVLVTDRMAPAAGAGRAPCTRSGCPTTGGPTGSVAGDAANELTEHRRSTPTCTSRRPRRSTGDIRPGRRPRGPARPSSSRQYRRRAGITEQTGTEVRRMTAPEPQEA